MNTATTKTKATTQPTPPQTPKLEARITELETENANLKATLQWVHEHTKVPWLNTIHEKVHKVIGNA